ncbi:hypothetical protein [Thiobacillus denitrificans]|uniref:hypothetical protein n=1 Tax=Thiobacillus denitrificans TaxID=36861 RepID=UPI000379E191|nr:hypothetical protein [Thiobacillus denitrificans]
MELNKKVLSLDEKISIKGKLATRGVLPSILVRLDAKAALFSWNLCFRRSIAGYYKIS